MGRHGGPILVDTNVILESFRIGAWRALSGGYALETVEDCVTETQTGFQKRRAEAVAYLLCRRNGVEARPETYLRHFVDNQTGDLDIYAIMRAAGQAEAILGLTAKTRLIGLDAKPPDMILADTSHGCKSRTGVDSCTLQFARI